VSQYANLEDLSDCGLPAAALHDVGSDIRDRALEKASGVADSYLRKRFTLPLVAADPPEDPWPDELTRAVVHIAACDLLARRGFVPGSGADQIVIDRKADAIDWLKDIAKGLAELDVEDSTPNVEEAGPLVASEEPQEWLLASQTGRG
jgi:phage gp36-like protein